jgi:hypothetical protein
LESLFIVESVVIVRAGVLLASIQIPLDKLNVFHAPGFALVSLFV